jgi:hypothetical protein
LSERGGCVSAEKLAESVEFQDARGGVGYVGHVIMVQE